MRYLIGTLFEEDEIKEKTKFQDMKARDEKGHMRWEGAFTGGFTAGYKNTCGSKEGWAPSTFVSSRDKRAEHTKQTINNFMDSDDLGRGELAQNIKLQSQFSTTSTAFNVTLRDSVGEKILNHLKKGKTEEQAPRDEQEVQKLFERYARQEQIEETAVNKRNYHFVDKNDFTSIDYSNIEAAQDPFVGEFEQLFSQLVRNRWKEETEEQKKKKKEQNKIYFDFTKPLEEQEDYLSEIVDQPIEDNPRKRVKTELFTHKLDELYIAHKAVRENEKHSQVPQVPEDYNPYLKMEQLAEKQKIKETAKTFHPNHNKTVQERSQLLGEKPLKQRIESQKFVRAQSQELGCKAELQFYLMNPEKQKRYSQFVKQMEGKIIGGDTGLDWKAAQLQRKQFEVIYQKAVQNGIATKTHSLETQLKAKEQAKVLDKIQRRKLQWKPQPLLCKRFGVTTPYTIDKNEGYL